MARTTNQGGREPTQVWINGEHFDSVIAARAECGALYGAKYKEFSQALYKTGEYRGKKISLTEPKRSTPKESQNTRGGALLRNHCTHRLGTFIE